jgi:glycosyltransferase involved in cell wall biosynthesis
VDPYEVADIATAIEELLDDPSMRDDLRERALARAGEFSWARVAQQTLEVYKQLGA